MSGPWEKYAKPGPWAKYGPQVEKVDIKGAVDAAQTQKVEEMGMGGRFLAGVGQGVSDLAYGAGQAVGLVDQETIRNKRDADAPLMATTAGNVGAVTGQVAAAIPAAFIPGANTATGAALTGTALGLATPVAEGNVVREKLVSGLVGAATGRAGFEAGKYIGNKIAGKVAQRNLQGLQNAGRDATLKRGIELGYAVEPTLANPSVGNRMLEGLAGKLTTAQAVAEKNQAVTNSLARQAIGLADDTPIDEAALNQVRTQAGMVYDKLRTLPGRVGVDARFQSDLQNIVKPFRQLAQDVPEEAGEKIENLIQSYMKQDFDPANVVTLIQRRRKEATTLYKAFDDPVKRDLAKAHRALADAFEDLLERHVTASGSPDLVDELKAARQLIAKTHSIESALNPGSGNVVARQLGNQLGKKTPLSGELLDIAKFAKAFPKSVQEVTSSMPGLSPLDYATAGITTAASGNPGALAMIGARPAVRAAITSAPYQRAFVQPSYGPTIGQKVLPRILQNKMLRAVPAAVSVNAVQQ